MMPERLAALFRAIAAPHLAKQTRHDQLKAVA